MLKVIVILAFVICGLVCAETVLHKPVNLGQETKLIELTENNFVAIRGVVDESTSSRFISDIMKIKGNRIYVYLTTPGGSVISGMSIVQTINTLQASGKEIVCIADRAASMGFVIFQACAQRYVMEHSILMQHQVSLGVEGQYEQVKSYLKMIETLDKKMNKRQAEKLGMSPEEFHANVQHDWWLHGEDGVENGAADEVVNVVCDFDASKTYEIKRYSWFGEINLQFSLCPLIHNPLSIKVDMSYDAKMSHADAVAKINNEYTNFEMNKNHI